MEKIDFKTSLLFAPLAYAIHHIEEHIFFNFREWRLTYFPNNNPLSTEVVLSFLMAITLFYIIYHQIASTKASAEGVLFLIMATQVHNIIFHLGVSLVTQSYSPGTITVILLYIPVNYLIIKKALQEELIKKKSFYVLFISGGLAFWLNEFFGIIYFIIGVILSWVWIVLAPKYTKTFAKISYRIMERIAQKSGSRTIDLVNNHELMGVTPEMLDWWWDHIDNTERYKAWHPKDHKSFIWENPSLNGHVGKIQRVIETIKIPTLLRIKWEDVTNIPILPSFSHVLAGSILDRNNKPISWLLHEYEPFQNGSRLRTTFRLPANVPRWFIKALQKHDIEEMAEFSNFLPRLFEENKKIKNLQ